MPDIFGLTLDDAIAYNPGSSLPSINFCNPTLSPYVPHGLITCLTFVEEHISEEGLYRVGGGTAAVQQLEKRFRDDCDAAIVPDQDPHTVTTYIKRYLRALPADLLPLDADFAYNPHMPFEPLEENAANALSPGFIRRELNNVPFSHYALLHCLMRHFCHVAAKAKQNKMSLANLARVFVPTLRLQYDVLLYLLQLGDDFWADFIPKSQRPQLPMASLYPVRSASTGTSSGLSLNPDLSGIISGHENFAELDCQLNSYMKLSGGGSSSIPDLEFAPSPNTPDNSLFLSSPITDRYDLETTIGYPASTSSAGEESIMLNESAIYFDPKQDVPHVSPLGRESMLSFRPKDPFVNSGSSLLPPPGKLQTRKTAAGYRGNSRRVFLKPT